MRHKSFSRRGVGLKSHAQLQHSELLLVPRLQNLDGEQWPTPHDLYTALGNQEFVLFYQPEIELATHRIVGVEALIRWRHPQRGLIGPAAFIPLAEECGLILEIGRWGLGEACRQIRAWKVMDPSLGRLRVCVNLSTREFAKEDICDYIGELLDEHSLDAMQLGVEVTETSLMTNIITAPGVLNRLREMGVALLMDDFGTGYSSLNYLQSFCFDVLKIDRSFVNRMTEGNNAEKIVQVIIELARVLNMEVIAEGIETMEQYKSLTRLGCRYGQGFLLARPLPVDEVTQLLQLPGKILPETSFAYDHAPLRGIA